MTTETLEEKTLEVESPAKEKDVVDDTEKEELAAPISDEAEKKEEVEEDKAREGELEEKGEEDNEDAESEEEKAEEKGSGSKNSSEKEPVTPSSDRPTRERKKVERFSLATPYRVTPSKSVSIEKGRGTRLREIPNVAYKLSKRKPDDNLILLHTILYGKKAKPQMLKKNIGQFSGFVWLEKEEEKQRGRVKEKLEKCIKEKLMDFCDVLDIPINRSSVRKEELSVKVLEFLEDPKATRDIILADREKKPAKKRKSKQKTVNSGESSEAPAKKKRQTKKSGTKRDQPSDTEEQKDEGDADSEGTNDSHEEDTAAPEEETEHEDIETEEEKDETEDEKPSDKKSSSKKETSGTKGKDKQASTEEDSHKNSAKSSKKTAKSASPPTKKQKVDQDEGKKQPSKRQRKAKKGKVEPTREEMLAMVSKILKEVDFNTATLSDILRKLSDHFGIDLIHRKAEVKEIITDAINEMTDEEEEDEEEEEKEENAEPGSDAEEEKE